MLGGRWPLRAYCEVRAICYCSKVLGTNTARVIYVTHCSAKKEPSLARYRPGGPCRRVIYRNANQRFMKRCRAIGVEWAIFSDCYGVWFPEVVHPWYEKDPASVTEQEFSRLLKDFDDKLERYERVLFYCNPGRFHSLYKRLIENAKRRDRIYLITHLREMVTGASCDRG
jgi:hypothetical protein